LVRIPAILCPFNCSITWERPECDTLLHTHDIQSTSYRLHRQSVYRVPSTTSYPLHCKYVSPDYKENFPTAL
jgi:hypothetical protein